MTASCSLNLTAETEAKKKALHEKLKVLVKKYINIVLHIKLKYIKSPIIYWTLEYFFIQKNINN